MDATPAPSPKALLAGLLCTDAVHLIIGATPLAATRCSQLLAAGARPVLVAPDDDDPPLHHGLRRHIDDGSLQWEPKPFDDGDLFRLGRAEVGYVVDAVFVTLAPSDPLAAHVSALCKKNRIPVNVVDAPQLCSLVLLSTHTDGPLQVGVTTNGRGCKLAARIRREIASVLPPGLGLACHRLGRLRAQLRDSTNQSDKIQPSVPSPDPGSGNGLAADGHRDGGSHLHSHHHPNGHNPQQKRRLSSSPGHLDDSLDQSALFNKLTAPDDEDVRSRRMRWLAQVCEYWPLKELATITDDDVDRLLTAAPYRLPPDALDAKLDAGQEVGEKEKMDSRNLGWLILAGSGPGHPGLLTQATIEAIHGADLVLADKLVPSAVLDLVPRRTRVQIARKFPGNADGAQEELLEAALHGVHAGKTVLRLKQGDPFLYGRGGEEVIWFGQRGLAHRVRVLPGISSALAAPLLAGVPVTQRDVADQLLICTGTGKKGAVPPAPDYLPRRTVVFLMALHRLAPLVDSLTETASWPPTTPCAVVERASCPDQRVIRTNLAHVVEAVEAEGSRPPGLLILGQSCQALQPPHQTAARRPWLVDDGFAGLLPDFYGGDSGGGRHHRQQVHVANGAMTGNLPVD